MDQPAHPNDMAFIGRGTAGIQMWHRQAVTWANEAAKRHGGRPLVVLPSKGSLEKDVRALLPRHFRIESFKSLLNAPGAAVVVAANLDRKGLQRVADQRPNALLILPWAGLDEAMPLLISHQARDLLGEVSIPVIDEVTTGIPEADAAIRSISSMTDLTFVNSLDRPKMVWAFRHLLAAGLLPERERVECMAVCLGWTLKGATELGELADRVRRRERMKAGTDPFRPSIIQRWVNSSDGARPA